MPGTPNPKYRIDGIRQGGAEELLKDLRIRSMETFADQPNLARYADVSRCSDNDPTARIDDSDGVPSYPRSAAMGVGPTKPSHPFMLASSSEDAPFAVTRTMCDADTTRWNSALEEAQRRTPARAQPIRPSTIAAAL